MIERSYKTQHRDGTQTYYVGPYIERYEQFTADDEKLSKAILANNPKRIESPDGTIRNLQYTEFRVGMIHDVKKSVVVWFRQAVFSRDDRRSDRSIDVEVDAAVGTSVCEDPAYSDWHTFLFDLKIRPPTKEEMREFTLAALPAKKKTRPKAGPGRKPAYTDKAFRMVEGAIMAAGGSLKLAAARMLDKSLNKEVEDSVDYKRKLKYFQAVHDAYRKREKRRT